VPQSGSGVGGTTLVLSTVTLNNSIVNFDPSSNVTINSLVVAGGAVLSGNNFSFGSAAPLQVRAGGSLKVTANQLTVPTGSPIEVQGGGSLALAVGANSGGALIVRKGGTFQQLNTQVINFDSISVESGGLLTHAANGSTRSSLLNLSVSGNFDLQAGATISANARGYEGGPSFTQPGRGPGGGGASGNGDGGGGGHGGAGGRGSSGIAGGSSYGSVTSPTDLGSGGGGAIPSAPGGAGGGAVLITVSGAFSVNGTINAGGGNGAIGGPEHGSGGGAGGTVNITAFAFNGSGSILANGGAGANNNSTRGGGGGGGRIALTGCNSDKVPGNVNGGAAGGSGAAGGGAGSVSPTVPSGCPSAPSTPTGLIITATGQDAAGRTFIAAAWDVAAQATDYTLQASSVADFSGMIFSATVSTTSATLAGLSPATTYFLRLAASNAIGSSAYSAPVSALTPPDFTAPQAPTLLSAVSRKAGAIELTWRPAATGEISTSFNVYRATTSFNSAGASSLVGMGIATTTFSDIPAIDGAYFYAVTALDHSRNESGLSNRLSALSIHAAFPPTDLTAALSQVRKQVDLAWNAPSTGTPASYNVFRSSGAQNTLIGTSTSTRFVDAPLEDAAYFYQATTLDTAGNESALSNQVGALFDTHAPSAVTDLRVAGVRSGEVDLLWTAPSDALSGVAGYLVRVATFPITTENFFAIAAVPAPQVLPEGSTVALTVLADSGKTLYFAARSTDSAGNLSALSNVAFLDNDPPVISGVSPAFGSGLSRPTRVSLDVSDLSGVSSVIFSVDGVVVATRAAAPFFFDWNTLAYADGEHDVDIRAVDAAGNSTVVLGLYALHYAPPAAPAISAPTGSFITFSATVTVAGSAEAGTTAQVRLNGVAAGSRLVGGDGRFSVPVVLPVEGDYQLTVVSLDSKGQSVPSSAVTVHYNLTPPNPPAAFEAETQPAGRVHLSWAVPTGKTPASYRLYRSPSAVALSSGVTPGSSLRIASGLTGTAFDDTPPSDGAYYYGATSLDVSGNESGLSDVASALSDRLAPTAAVAAPSNVTAGTYPLTLTVSKPLSAAPLLLFLADGAGPLALSLAPQSATVWTGTLTVTSATNPGPAVFQFQGTDFAGNTGTTITSGRTLLVDNRGPVGAVTLYPFPPLPAGPADLALILDEPAASTPTLAFVTAAGATIAVALEGAGATWTAVLSVPPSADGAAVFHYSAVDALGNVGAALSAGGSFVIDATPPGAPLSLGAASRPAGVVRLSWSGPLGEPAAAYRIYRDSVALPGTTAPAADQTGRFDDLPVEGAHLYQVAALDAAGNESARSSAAQGLSDATPPLAPATAVALINAFSRVEVGWPAQAGESYRLYRATYDPVSLAGLSFFNAPVPPFVDAPPQNGLIRYAVTAVDGAGNVSTGAARASVFFDRAPPLITLTGVAEGGLYNAAVFPAYSASDPALDTATVAGRLNGASFASGGAVEAEGDYILEATAASQAGIASTVTVHFTLDRSSPIITVEGVVSGQTYRQAVLPLISVADPRLGAVSLTLNGFPYTAGVPIAADGAYALVLTAHDAAGNVASSTMTFTLDPAPPAPAAFMVAAEEGLGAALSWQSPAADAAGYRALRDGAPLHQGLLAEPRFFDPSFVPGRASVYEVAAVDASGQEGARARASLPAVTMELESYGSLDNGAPSLVRGFFDAVRLRLANGSSSAKLIGPTTLELISGGAVSAAGSAPSLVVAGGAQAVAAGVLPIPVNLPETLSLRATVNLPVEPGASATLRRTFAVASRAPREPILEVFPEPLVRGTNKNVRVKVNNQGSAPLELLSLNPSDLQVELRTPEGTTLSSARLSQSGNGAQASAAGYFVPVPGGASALLDPVSLFIPDALGASAQLRVRLDRVFNDLFSGGQQGPRSFETVKTLSGASAPPYRATVRSEFALYDQGSLVRLFGEAFNEQGQLVPGATVQLGVSLRGFERAAGALTDQAGRYEVTFAPTPFEAGVYTLWAGHPDVVDRAPQSSFTIVGLAFQFSDFTAALTQNSTVPFRVSLTNTGQTRVEGLSAVVLASAALPGAGLTLDPASLPAALDAGQSASLSLNATASASAALGRSRLTLRLSESHGFVRELPVYADVAASAPAPVLEPASFNIGLSAGQSRTLEVHLKNAGRNDWQGVLVGAPAVSWARLSGPTSLGDIPPGGSKSLFLILEPPAGLPSQAFAFNPLVELRSANAASVPLNALVTITASGQGNVLYTAINADKPRDQFGAGEPLAAAEASLVSLDVAGLSFHAVADSNGLIRLLNIPAGRYSYTAKAPGFEDVSGVETIEPGVTLSREVLLPTNVVSYEWTVEPTTILDRYDLKLGITFKTDVPAPVVVIDPAVMNFNLAGGQSVDAQMTVENKGLVSAFDVELKPRNSDPAVAVDMPFDRIPELRAGQKIVVPFRLSLAHASCHSEQIDGGYGYVCAAGTSLRKQAPPVSISVGDCDLPPISVGGGGGGAPGFGSGPGGSGSGGSLPSVPGPSIPILLPNPPSPPAPPNSCRPPEVKYPSQCSASCDTLGSYSDPGGDPRVPESDLSLSVPKFGGSLDFTRVYDSQDFDEATLGKSWSHSFDSRVRLTRAATVFFRDRAENTAYLADYSDGSQSRAFILGQDSLSNLTPDLLVELRTPSGRRLIFRHTGGSSFSAPAGETSTLTLQGSTAAPTGFFWTLADKTIYAYDDSGKLVSMTDRNNNRVSLVYSGGLLSEVKDPDNRTLYTLSYTGGKLAGVTDLAGRTLAFTYDASGHLSQVDGPNGTSTYGYAAYEVPNLDAASFANGLFQAYSALRLLTSVTSPNGHVTSFTYGAPSKVVDYSLMELYQADGGAQLFTLGNAGFGAVPVKAGSVTPPTSKSYYTPLLQLSSSAYAIDTEGFARWYFPQRFWTTGESGPLGSFTFEHTVDELLEGGSTVVTDPLGHKETHYWESKQGRAQTGIVQDAGGGQTKTVYDVNRYPAQVTNRAGRVTSLVYDAKGNLTRATDPAGQSAVFSYEPNFNNIASISDPKGNQTSFSYDSSGNLTHVEDALHNVVALGHDANGLPSTITDPDNKTITLGRDAQGLVTSITDPLNQTARVAYDAQGRVTNLTDSAGKTTQLAYDPADNLSQVTDALNGVTRYDYVSGTLDSGKLLDKVHDPKNQATSFGYDSRGRLTSVSNTLSQSRGYQYDAGNRLTQLTKPDGAVISFVYDPLGRLLSKTLPEGVVHYGYDAAGNLTQVSNYNGSVIGMAYDSLDRVVQNVQTLPGGFTATIGYAYDANGNRTSMTTPWGSFSYGYDALNRLTSLTNPQGKTFTFSYDAVGRRTRLAYPNGIEASYAYDAASRLTQVLHKRVSDGMTAALANYTYDAAGNRTSMEDTTGVHVYTYDDLHRLISATHPPGSHLETKNETFSYDAVGNRLADAKMTGYAYDTANRLLSNSSFTYAHDASGNQTSKTDRATQAKTGYSYDSENRLVQVNLSIGGEMIAKYNALGRRVEKSTGSATNQTVQYLYDGPNILAMLDGNNNPVATFSNGLRIGEPLLMRQSNGTEFFYHADALGSIMALTGATGDVVERVESEVYGKPTYIDARSSPLIASQSFVGNPFAFTTLFYDFETGLFVPVHRTYDPTIGRFGQEDPLGLNGGDVNLFTYVGNNPINYTDPWGLYGTNDCSYYERRCKESGGAYYCEIAPRWCKRFPRYPDPDPSRDDDFEGLARCIRQCLQDCDRDQKMCSDDRGKKKTDPSTDSFFDQKPTACHFKCYTSCGVQKGRHPLTP
jgi:RHS repeat-associated protein